MTDDIRRMFDLLETEPSPEFVSGLRARLMDVTTQGATETATATDADNEEDLIMTITEERRDQSTAPDHGGRRAVRWLAAAAVAAGLVVTGVLVANRDDDNNQQPADDEFPAPTALEESASLNDSRIGQIAFADGFIWASTQGSTFLAKIDPETAQIVDSLSLPDGSTSGNMTVAGDLLYVPTHGGVVIVDTTTGEMSEQRAGEGMEIGDIAVGSDATWLVRLQINGQTMTSELQKWNRDVTEMQYSVDLGDTEIGALESVGDGVYLGTGQDGLRHYDADGNVVATIDVGYTIRMDLGPDGRLWVPDYDDGTLRAVDTATDEIVGEVELATTSTIDVAAVNGAVFAVNWSNARLHAVDPATYTETVKVALPGNPLSVLVAGDTVWVAGEGFLRGYVAAG
ncbi:MAG TPA: hypothetical protein VL916_10610 [Ilumatobacteraceae bacterium]|nr:hypothetical protein [Ilumatobacteraceae bacterium]